MELAHSLRFICLEVARCQEVGDMCSVKWRKVGEQYICSFVREDGTEELITAGTREKMIRFLRTNGFEHIDPGLIEDNLDSWCS